MIHFIIIMQTTIIHPLPSFCQINITDRSLVVALFATNLSFGRKNAFFSAFHNMLKDSTLRKRGLLPPPANVAF